MKIVTPAEMKAMDQRTVEEGLYSSVELMGNAAAVLYEEVSAELDRLGEKRVLLLAGFGNNGGDAYALALLLQQYYQPVILPVGEGKRSADCAYYYERCQEAGIPFAESVEEYPLVIDGVFGTGFRGELPSAVKAMFEKIKSPVLSIDLPSGMNGETGLCSPGTLRPIRTVTFAFLKPCHLLADCGQVVLKDIGIPVSYAAEITREVLQPKLPERTEWGHKNGYGAVGLLVGAPIYPGAAALALTGAMRSGVGLVFGYLPRFARQAAAAKFFGAVLQTPCRLFPLKCNAYLAGSGLGRGAAAGRKIRRLWKENVPLVVDGDGFWHLQKKWTFRKAPTVLTPHMGEFARMAEKTVGAIKADRLKLAEEFAARYGVVLVLKDAATVVTDGKQTQILSAPCSALAKGGSGDLLAGLTAGLLAQGLTPMVAAVTAVWLHNRAGHLAAAEHSARYLQPEEIALKLDRAWMELEHEEL